MSNEERFWHENCSPEIEKNAFFWEDSVRVKKKICHSRNIFSGILLTFFALGILGVTGFFLFLKYSQPPSLAKILPAEETLFFAEIQTNVENPEWQNLRNIFAGSPPPVELGNFNSLGFANAEEFLGLLRNRIGIAFFGEDLNPNRFLLVMDVADVNLAREFLTAQTLTDETLTEKNYLHQKIYSYPRSRKLAFSFFGNDLLLASERKDLEKIARVIHDSSKSLKNSTAFQAVVRKINPRSTGFAYFSEKMIQQTFTSNIGGMRNVLATPLLDFFESGGVTFIPRNGGVQFAIRLALKGKFVHSNLFVETETVNFKILDFLNEDTKIFWATKNSTAQLSHFLTASEKTNPAFPLLLKGIAKKLTREWFGKEISFAKDISPIFENASMLGKTNSGEFFGIFENTESEALLEKLISSRGKLAADEKLVALPDTTPGHELAIKSESAISEELFASHKITQIRFPKYELNFVKLDNFLVFTSEKKTLEKMIICFVAEEKIFENLLIESGIADGNIFFMRVENSENTFLKPFRFVLAGVDFGVDEIKIELSLEK